MKLPNEPKRRRAHRLSEITKRTQECEYETNGAATFSPQPNEPKPAPNRRLREITKRTQDNPDRPVQSFNSIVRARNAESRGR